MDAKLLHVRADVDRILHRAREEMDSNIELERDNMLGRVKRERESLDRKLLLYRVKMDSMLREERKNMDMLLKRERESMDTRFKEEREEMDRTIQMDRLSMDAEIMQARAQMDMKLIKERDDMDLKILGQEETPTEHIQMDNITSPEAHEECFTWRPPKIVWEFRVHMVGKDYFTNPEKYDGDRCGEMNFCEPLTVEWHSMLSYLEIFGFKRSSVLYYLDPTREPPLPLGLVEMSGPKQVQEMLHADSGTKKSHLYLVNDYSEDEEYDIPHETLVEVPSVTANNFKRDRDSMDYNKTDEDHSEDGSSQPKKHHAVSITQ